MVEDSSIDNFIDEKSIKALETLIKTNDKEQIFSSSLILSKTFGFSSNFNFFDTLNINGEAKLISSFAKNLTLLIQKTWIEKSDEALKAQVLYHLEEFCHQLNAHSYTASYKSFFSIVDDVVYLMFGDQAKLADFDEYAFRIDPEFGFFWWYINNLPRQTRWTEAKSRIIILLGMYFLANY